MVFLCIYRCGCKSVRIIEFSFFLFFYFCLNKWRVWITELLTYCFCFGCVYCPLFVHYVVVIGFLYLIISCLSIYLRMMLCLEGKSKIASAEKQGLDYDPMPYALCTGNAFLSCEIILILPTWFCLFMWGINVKKFYLLLISN